MILFGIPNVTLLRAIDYLGLIMQDCFMRSTSSSDDLGRPVDFCFSTVPVSLNWFIHRFKPCPLEVFLLDVNFATYAALRQPISVLHTKREIEPSGEPSTSCRPLIKTERPSHVHVLGSGWLEQLCHCLSVLIRARQDVEGSPEGSISW